MVGTLTVASQPVSAEAASGSDFNAGNIISDAIFYDSGTMSQGQIQLFLNNRVPNCASGFVCLKDYSQATASQSAKAAGCSAYQGSGSESAAAIIYKVAQACGINPQALIVLLEKEQAIVSDSTPSARQYRSATGYGCPDTADCDANFYGFFNQLYNAAYQFKKYQADPTIRGYIAGRWNNILWNPSGACGSSSVYIENQATAGLYVYTPYRPNGAALANMYGSGDGCSSYGNRNFFRMFTDWFGSTTGGSSFVRDNESGGIFLISGTKKHHVPSLEVYNTLTALGGYRNVPPSYLTGYTTGVDASALVRDPLTGGVSLVQGGTQHSFNSCTLVDQWGYSCGSVLDLMPNQLNQLPQGGAVSSFHVVPGSSAVYWIDGGARYPITQWADVERLNGGSSPWVGTMTAQNSERFPLNLLPGSAIKTAANASVFLVDGTATKVPVSSMGVLSEYGTTTVNTVSQQVLDKFATAGTALTIVNSCSSNGLALAHDGNVSALTANHGTGIATTALDGATCNTLNGVAPISNKVFVKSASSASVYYVADGVARAVFAWRDVVELNGGSDPVIVTMSAETITLLARGAWIVAPNSLIKVANQPVVFMTDGLDRKLRVDSFGTTSALGAEDWRTVPNAVADGYGTSVTSATRVVICGSTTYFGAGGTLYPVSGANPHGITATQLSAASCGLLNKSTAAPANKTFVKASNDASVYYVYQGKRRSVTSWSDLVAINGGGSPIVHTVGVTELNSLPDGGRITP